MRLTLLLLLCAAPLRAAEQRPSLPREDAAPDLVRLRFELADRITAGVLDPILGKGRAFAFVDFSLELARSETGNEKLGRGTSGREKRKTEGAQPSGAGRPEPEDDPDEGFLSPDPAAEPGAPARTKGRGGATASTGAVVASESRQRQYSRQSKTERESRDLLDAKLRGMRVVVVHLPPADPKRLAAARETLLTVFPDALDSKGIVFRAAPPAE